jgi:hypothetical protein
MRNSEIGSRQALEPVQLQVTLERVYAPSRFFIHSVFS